MVLMPIPKNIESMESLIMEKDLHSKEFVTNY